MSIPGKKSIKKISSQKILLFLFSCIRIKLIRIEYKFVPEFPKKIFFLILKYKIITNDMKID
jgi:hypothetical protein